jgi:hypothetical protein
MCRHGCTKLRARGLQSHWHRDRHCGQSARTDGDWQGVSGLPGRHLCSCPACTPEFVHSTEPRYGISDPFAFAPCVHNSNHLVHTAVSRRPSIGPTTSCTTATNGGRFTQWCVALILLKSPIVRICPGMARSQVPGSSMTRTMTPKCEKQLHDQLQQHIDQTKVLNTCEDDF